MYVHEYGRAHDDRVSEHVHACAHENECVHVCVLRAHVNEHVHDDVRSRFLLSLLKAFASCKFF